MKRYFNLNENAAGASGGGSEEPVQEQVQSAEQKQAPNFAALSPEMFEADYDSKKNEAQQRVESKNEEDVKEKEKEALQVENVENKESVDKEKDTKEAEQSSDKEKAEENGSENVVELTLDEKVDDVEQEDNVFVTLGKDLLGIDITENTYEAFASETKKAIETAEERGKSWSIQKELAELPPEAQVDFLLLRSGLTREEIDKPTAVVDKYLSMSNIDLVREDLKLQDLPEPVIEKEIEILTEKGLIDHNAEKLKAGLKQQREEILEGRKELANRVATEYEASKQLQKTADIESMTKVFNTVNEFMGLPLNQQVGQTLAKEYADGTYDNVFNDPKSKAEFILFKKLGENAIKIITNKAMEEGRKKVTQHLSNVPVQTTGHNSKASHKTSAVSSAGFEGLADIFKQ